ncbi:hypothetical protein HWV62_19247 [Athelia sp. TMB]|nr:hypothetical protein HWV62_19247 [Athelia sp. TMB]
MSHSESYDYIVAGAGTAGLVVAARLSEDPTVTVCVVEAGGDLSLDEVIKEPEVQLQNMMACAILCLQTCGRSPILPMLAIEALGSEGWNWENLLQYFNKVRALSQRVRQSETFTDDPVVAKELNVQVNEEYHGRQGPLKTTLPYWNPELLVTYHEAAQSMGNPANPDSNGGDNVGTLIGTVAVDTKTGHRCSSASQYYEPNKSRANLHAITNARVTRVVFQPKVGADDLVADGLEYVQDGKAHTVLAKKQVIICAGAYQTPQLLELSEQESEMSNYFKLSAYLSCTTYLEWAIIYDHMSITSTVEIDPKYLTINPFGKPETAKERAEMANGLSSAFTFMPTKQFVGNVEGVSEAVKNHNTAGTPKGAAKTVELQKEWFRNDKIPHMEVTQCSFFNPILGTLPKPGASYLTYFIALLHPFSRGSVHIASSDPLSNPVIDPAFLDNPIDLALFVDALKWVRKLIRTAKLAPIVRDEITPAPGLQTDAELEDFVRNTVGTVFHCVGSASMLPEDDGGVVDAKMRVYGTKNLRVVDASIIPVQVSAHTQATVYAVAEKVGSISVPIHGRQLIYLYPQAADILKSL